jgi:hypothetical protein
MESAAALVLATAAYPLGRAWLANRTTTLVHALTWAILAWLAWFTVLLAAALGLGDSAAARYVALALTGCAGVAVLGARRPGVGPWHFVALGLLVVLLLPLAEGFGRLSLSLPRLIFLAAALAVAFLNYVPTRLAPAALLAGAGCGIELASLARGERGPLVAAGRLALAAAPWTAYLMIRWGREPASEIDRTWRLFRDGFGALWAERMREQFNRAAANAGLTGRLGWGGLKGAPAAEAEALLATLRALLKRFGPADSSGEPRR